MSRTYPYMSDKAPLAYAEARYRLVTRLERIYGRALDERIEYCKQHNIEYLHTICKPSPDAITDKLSKRYLSAHVEALMLRLNISRRHGKC